MNFSAVLNHWLHLVSAIIWIGGSAYQVFVLSAHMKSGDLPREKLLNIAKRFRRISLVALITLVFTGGINLGIRRAGHEFIPPGYISALGVKVFLIVAMASGLVFGLVRSPKQEDPAEEDPTALPGIGITKMTLAIGTIVIFIAAMLRQWKF
ncbi:MAG: hypothetical protein ACE5GK_05370 [Nitrospiria bacterium]